MSSRTLLSLVLIAFSIVSCNADPDPKEGETKAAPKDKAALKAKLTPLQYEVAVENGTEPPFRNEYWDNKEEGIYVDVRTENSAWCGWKSDPRPVTPTSAMFSKTVPSRPACAIA